MPPEHWLRSYPLGKISSPSIRTFTLPVPGAIACTRRMKPSFGGTPCASTPEHKPNATNRMLEIVFIGDDNMTPRGIDRSVVPPRPGIDEQGEVFPDFG